MEANLDQELLQEITKIVNWEVYNRPFIIEVLKDIKKICKRPIKVKVHEKRTIKKLKKRTQYTS